MLLGFLLVKTSDRFLNTNEIEMKYETKKIDHISTLRDIVKEETQVEPWNKV